MNISTPTIYFSESLQQKSVIVALDALNMHNKSFYEMLCFKTEKKEEKQEGCKAVERLNSLPKKLVVEPGACPAFLDSSYHPLC